MNKKRGLLVVFMVVFLVFGMVFVLPSEPVFDVEVGVFSDNLLGFDYTYALGIGGVDDETGNGDVCTANQDELKFGILKQTRNGNEIDVSYPEVEGQSKSSLPSSLINIGPAQCSWKTLPLDIGGCYFLSSEDDYDRDKDISKYRNIQNDCGGYIIPPDNGKFSVISGLNSEAASAKDRFFEEAEDGTGAEVPHSFFVIREGIWDGLLEPGQLDVFPNGDAACLFNEYTFTPREQSFVCHEEENQFRWYICDAEHVSKNTGKFLPLEVYNGGSCESDSDNPDDVLTSGCDINSDPPQEKCVRGKCIKANAPSSSVKEYVSTSEDEATHGYFCEQEDLGSREFIWTAKKLTCENLEEIGSSCEESKVVCEDNDNSWLEINEDQGACCGNDGLEDLGKPVFSKTEDKNYLCLSSDESLVGTKNGKVTEVGASWPLRDGGDGSGRCSEDWCWVEASSNAKFNVYTIKPLAQPAYDVVSNGDDWFDCTEKTEAEGGELTLPDSGENKNIANRFYCYKEGDHYSWAECVDPDRLQGGDVKTIKTRYAGDALYTLVLDEPNDEGEGYSGEAGEVSITPRNSAYQYYYERSNSKFGFDFTGYDYLEFMVKFVDESPIESEPDENDVTTLEYPAMPMDQLALPAELVLTIKGPETESGEDFIYFDKNVLQYIERGPFFADSWMHAKVPIAGYKDVKQISFGIGSKDTNYIGVKNVFLSKEGEPTKICSGKESPVHNSWLTNLDEINGRINGEDLCTSLYGEFAWLGDGEEVGSTARCCGNTPGEYYAGPSRNAQTEEGKDPIYYGCWNSQPIQSGKSVMDVQFEVEYDQYTPEILYEDRVFINYDLAITYGKKINFVQGRGGLRDHITIESVNIREENTLLVVNTDLESLDPTHEFEIDHDRILSEQRIKLISTSSPVTRSLEEFLGFRPYSELRGIEEEYSFSYNYNRIPIRIVLIDNIENGVKYSVDFFNTKTGEKLDGTLNEQDLKDLENIVVVVQPAVQPIYVDPPYEIDRITETKNYSCASDECLFPAPGVLSNKNKIKNLHPELYELYFITENVIEGNKATETRLVNENLLYEEGTLLAKGISQQVILFNEGVDAEEDPIFYGCQAASYVGIGPDGQPLDRETFKNVPPCSPKAGQYCAYSIQKEKNRDKFTVINSWNPGGIEKVGYADPEASVDFGEQERNLKDPDDISLDNPILPINITHSSSILPARNMLSNAQFEPDGNQELPHWDIFVNGMLLSGISGDDEENRVEELEDGSGNSLVLREGELLRSEKVAIPQMETLHFSSDETCRPKVFLINNDGESQTGHNGEREPVENLEAIKTAAEGFTASFLIIEVNGPCSISKPMLQLLEDEGDFEPVEYYKLPWQQYYPGDDPRAGIACCPDNYCWNGYACVEPMEDFTKLSEEVEEGRNYRCVEGEWKYQPLKFDWKNKNWGFCNDVSQCFVMNSVEGALSTNNAQDFLMGQYPTCINNGEYVLDNYCQDGEWTSRTKFVAQQLLEVAQDGEYILYCANLWDALIDSETFQTVLEGEEPGVAGDIPDVPSGEGDYGEAHLDQKFKCFPAISASESASELVEDKENTCVNKVCVLKYKDSGAFKVAFGTSLNKDIQGKEEEGPNSFLQALNIDVLELGPLVNSCEESEGFAECDLTDLPLTGDLWYSRELNATIYSRDDLTPGIIDRAIDWIRGALGLRDDTSAEFIENTENFLNLYLLDKSDKKVRAVKALEGTNETVVAEYENFETPVCDYIANKEMPLTLTTEPLEAESGNNKVYCTTEGNIHRIEAVANSFGGTDELWKPLTGKLRVE